MSYRFGTIRGLDACAASNGTFTMLALDHRNNLRRILGPDDPEAVTYEDLVEFKRDVVGALAGAATGVLIDPEVGAAQAVVEGAFTGNGGLIVTLEQSGYGGTADARISDLIPGWSVAQAKRMGADGVKLLLYYHPDAINASDQERLLMEVAEACTDADLPLFLEPLGFSIDGSGAPLTGEARRDVVVRTARRLTMLGGDVLKAEFPYDASVADEAAWTEACAELDAASSVPWVLLSAGVDAPTFEAQTRVACQNGASGVLVGRSVWGEGANLPAEERVAWQAGEGAARLGRLRAIVESDAKSWRERTTLLAGDPIEPGWFVDYPA